MGETITTFVGDTAPIEYLLTKKNLDDDMCPVVDLDDKTVYITIRDMDHETYDDIDYEFETTDARDAYFDEHETELVRGLLVTVGTTTYRYDGTAWSTSPSIVVNAVECTVDEVIKGHVLFYPTEEEMRYMGMYIVYFRVKVSVDSVTTYEKFPKNKTLFLRIMDK